MKLSHTLFSAFIGSVMAFSGQAFAADGHTAEYDLVNNVRAIAATATSATQVQTEYQTALTAYNEAAVKDGAQNTRFVQALVDNQVYTQVQAEALFSSAMTSSTQSLAQGSDMIATEMSRLASTQLRGGQFSACGFTGGTVLVAGIAAVVYGAVVGHGTTSCSGVSDGNSTVGGCNTTGPSSSQQNLSRDLYIGGAIGIGAGVVLLIAAGSGC